MFMQMIAQTMNKILSKVKYPKFLLLILTFAIAYFIFKQRDFLPFHSTLLSLGYAGAFLAGIFFAYGFTAAPATAILLILAKEQNILLSGFIAGFGALIGDLLIFRFVRHSFADEIERLSKEKAINRLSRIPAPFKKYLTAVFIGFIIASPLPDEIGVSLLVAVTKISTRMFSVFSYTLNTAGIFAVLAIGKII